MRRWLFLLEKSVGEGETVMHTVTPCLCFSVCVCFVLAFVIFLFHVFLCVSMCFVSTELWLSLGKNLQQEERERP